MLSPVNASISSEFVLSPQIVQDGGGQQAMVAAKADAALAILSLASENQAGVKLAGLLGTAGVASGDVLTNLALNFGKVINVLPAEGELINAFATRLADAIFSMSALERIAAESKSGLMALGISASALAAALKNPNSAAAARLVALIETRLTSPRDSALKMAISNYQATSGREQGSHEPAVKSAVLVDNTQSSARNVASNERGVEVLRLLQGGKPSGGNGLLAAGQSTVRSMVSSNTAASALQAAATQSPAVGKLGQAAQAHVPAEAGRADVQAGRQTVLSEVVGADKAALRESGPLINGAKSVVASGGTNLQTNAAVSSALNGTAAAIAASAARGAGKSAAIADFMRETIARSNSQEGVVAAAQKVAAAVAQRQVLLFNAASPSEDGKEDLEKQISRALGNAARASQAAAVAMVSADHVQQQAAQPQPGVPYAQVPYPQADTEEAKRKSARDGRDGEQDEDENGGGDEQSMQDGDGEQGKEAKRHAQEEPVNDNPFEAEEPLERHASDADRAYHMYQKFGGF